MFHAKVWILVTLQLWVLCPRSDALPRDACALALDYFTYKRVSLACYLSCDTSSQNNYVTKLLNKASNMRVSVQDIGRQWTEVDGCLYQWTASVGVLLDGVCVNAAAALKAASQAALFDTTHAWLVTVPSANDTDGITDGIADDTIRYVDDLFQPLNLSVDADIVVAVSHGDHYQLTDVFNFGKIQGNYLETNPLGAWRRDAGVAVLPAMAGFKYYHRWDFHNLTLRAISVILDLKEEFHPALLEDVRYSRGVSAMTKIVAQLLNALKQQHNFRFNYTIVGRWVGSPKPNSTLAVTNSLFWRQQDISCTCLRVNPQWLEWVDPFLPPATLIETKVYYLIPDKGTGSYENRFLTPLSPSVWWSTVGVGALCCVVLGAAAAVEHRTAPVLFALCSVLAAACQQAYEDGVQVLSDTSSQGGRLTLLVVGATSMVLYNYYTSSVVSWLLNAPAPTLATLDGLIHSDLELAFEDVGYTRGWLDNPGFYYYSGYKNPKEDELRERKVTNVKRTVPVLLPVETGIELIRTGSYAYHTEPYTASQVLSRRLSARELCELGALQLMPPGHVYIMGQKRSPYRHFFTWSLMRLSERGHLSAARARVGGHVPTCPGTVPRALALGQAAPAFLLLALGALAAGIMLGGEMLWHRLETRDRVARGRLLERPFNTQNFTREKAPPISPLPGYSKHDHCCI